MWQSSSVYGAVLAFCVPASKLWRERKRLWDSVNMLQLSFSECGPLGLGWTYITVRNSINGGVNKSSCRAGGGVWAGAAVPGRVLGGSERLLNAIFFLVAMLAAFGKWVAVGLSGNK